MTAWCERAGQFEVGVIEHAGRQFRAGGASVIGRALTGYTRLVRGDIHLTTWGGRTTLACRSEVVEEYRDGALALLFRLTHGRFVAGYALGENGMLFRGELVTGGSAAEAQEEARRAARYWGERDAEDEAVDQDG
jgi:hypothetical protein